LLKVKKGKVPVLN